jgi:hypothetical protein
MLGMIISETDSSVADANQIEVSLVSKLGFWILIEDEELFLAYTDFPWFKTATIEQITLVERPSKNHLYWPNLDVDLSLESIRNPDLFPLISKTEKH